jgi:hypothetical protein
VHFGALNESCAKVQILAHDLLQIWITVIARTVLGNLKGDIIMTRQCGARTLDFWRLPAFSSLDPPIITNIWFIAGVYSSR